MGELFGTDGIRGIAYQYPVTPETGYNLGRALVRILKSKGIKQEITIGRDTRISGESLEHGICSGIQAESGKVYRLGVTPTPAVAYLTRKLGAGAGIVISASHNPYEYNGFKVFSDQGFKLSEQEEADLEKKILAMPVPQEIKTEKLSPADLEIPFDPNEAYLSFLKQSVEDDIDISGLKIVLDCSNGATSRIAPQLFKDLGLEVSQVLFANPDGKNINLNCGSEHTSTLQETVLETKADIGIAFDGDGDRFIAIDEKGEVVDGDQILIICAKMLLDRKKLKNNLLISTVMSNLGLKQGLEKLGIRHLSSSVGDRHVMEVMRANDAILGGEESGHIIFFDYHSTGDGLLSAIQFLRAIKFLGQPVSKIKTLMSIFPKILLNIPVATKPEISSLPGLTSIIQKVEQDLGDKGRVLVRYSGTEPLLRVMVEGEDETMIKSYAHKIADIVKQLLT